MPPFVIIVFIICVVVGLIIVKTQSIDFMDFIMGAVASFFVSFAITFLLTLVAAGILTCANPKTYLEETPVKTYDIISLNDNLTSYVGRYYNGSNLQYITLYKTDKGITNKTVDADICYINYSESPCMEEYKKKYSNSILDFFFGDAGKEYFIYIPEGSIIQDSYVIDLE